MLGSRVHRHHLRPEQVKTLEDLTRRFLTQLVGHGRVQAGRRMCRSRPATVDGVAPVAGLAARAAQQAHTRNNIERENRRAGTGGKPRCRECKRWDP